MKKFTIHFAIYLIICAITFLTFLSCRKANQPPSARLEVFPAIGDTSVTFEFDAGKSTDDLNYPIGLTYRWDIDGDGSWDTDFAPNKTFAYKYNQPGTYQAAVEVKDLDGLTSTAKASVVAFGENKDLDSMIDSRDGNRYATVKIQGRWWMAENLRYGVEIQTSLEQTNNGTVERYLFRQWKGKDTVGGVYRWLEAMNYNISDQQGICPDGWHLPTASEWSSLLNPYPFAYACKYYGRNGLSKLNLDLNCHGDRWEDGTFWELPEPGGFWSSSFRSPGQDYWPFAAQFDSDHNHFDLGYWETSGPENHWHDTSYFSVRCIKDN